MNKTGFTTIDLFILIIYLAAVLFAGLYFSKKEMKGKEFLKVMVPFLGMLPQYLYLLPCLVQSHFGLSREFLCW